MAITPRVSGQCSLGLREVTHTMESVPFRWIRNFDE